MRPEIIQSCLANILKKIKSKDDNDNKESKKEIYIPKHANKEDIKEEHLSI